MKKKISAIVALALSGLVAASAAGCGGTPATSSPTAGEVYSVNVVNGSGTGVYRSGQSCTAVAEVTDGMQFDGWYMGVARVGADGEWYVEEVKVATDLTYTFTVGEDTDLVAKLIPRQDLCTLTVEGGIISGTDGSSLTTTMGSSVTITANVNQTREFLYWIIEGMTESVTQSTYTFTINSDTSVVGVYRQLCLVAVEGGTISGGDGSYGAGDECTVVADTGEDGSVFAYWYYEDANGEEVVVSDQSTYTFTVSTSIILKARFVEPTVVNITGGTEIQSGQSQLNMVRGEYCTIIADLAPAGKQFKSWSVNGTEVPSAGRTYTFRTNQSEYNITANYVDTTAQAPTLDNTTQGFNWYMPDGTYAQAAEFFRYGRPSDLFDTTDYLIYYIYDSQTANKDDYVGMFYVYNEDSGYAADEFVSADGQRRISYDGGSGDACIQGTAIQTALDPFMEYCIGEEFDEMQNYYFAIRRVGKIVGDEVYGDSDISAIGNGAYNKSGTKQRV